MKPNFYKRCVKTATALSVLLFASYASAQTYFPDSSFAGDGNAVADFAGLNANYAEDMLVQPDGKILVGGYTDNFNIWTSLLRLDPCGNPDVSFGDSGKVNYSFTFRDQTHAIALQPDGKIVTAGHENTSNGGSGLVPTVMRFNTDGTPDYAFGDSGRVAQRFDAISSGEFFRVWVLPGGRVIAVGKSSSNINGGVTGMGVMRFMPDGALDPAFDGDGMFRYPVDYMGNNVDGAQQSDGKIVTVSNKYNGSGYDVVMTRVDTAGALDTTFATAGFGQYPDDVQSQIKMAMLPDDKFLVAATTNGTYQFWLGRFNANGTPDSSFGVNGNVFLQPSAYAELHDVSLAPGGKILLAGRSTDYGVLMRLNPNGGIDSTFADNGVFFDDVFPGGSGDYIAKATYLPGDRILYAGGVNDFYVGRVMTAASKAVATYDGSALSGNNLPGQYQWYVDGVAIPSATANGWTPTQNGTYQFQLTDPMGCVQWSNTVEVTNVGIVEVGNALVEIYPNPVTENLLVNVKQFTDASIEIVSVDGKVLQLVNARSSSVKVDVSKLSAGVYFVRVVSKAGSGIIKVVKQ